MTERLIVVQCALTKLGYLLSKKELSRSHIRELIGSPLRGELTKAGGTMVKPANIDDNMDGIQNVLAQFLRLSQPSHTPKIEISSVDYDGDPSSQDAAAPWSWTVTEAAGIQATLFPFLIHLAAARDDLVGLNFCLRASGDPEDAGSTPSGDALTMKMIPGGIVNCLDPGSGRSPLHVAALNGHARIVEALLRSGALVHLRDALGHTALYLVRPSTRSLDKLSIHLLARPHVKDEIQLLRFLLVQERL